LCDNQILSLSLCFNSHSPGEPGLAGVYWSKKEDGSGDDSWSYRSCKAPVKSLPPTNQYQVFFTSRMRFLSPNQLCQSTEGKISHSMDLLTPNSPGVFQLSLWPLIAAGYLREVCHASHQPSDASTLDNQILLNTIAAAVAAATRLLQALQHILLLQLTWREPRIFLTLEPSHDNPHVLMLPFLFLQQLLNHQRATVFLFFLFTLWLQHHSVTYRHEITSHCTYTSTNNSLHNNTRNVKPLWILL